MAQHLAQTRLEIEEQATSVLDMQVQRIREIEVGQAKLAEAARWRRALQVERAELERLYSDRVTRLRTQEEALVAKMREQCREVERVAFEQRQRVAEEDERMRAMHAVRCSSSVRRCLASVVLG
jgi:hypothetical protein